jgi:hypothetical protein
MSAGLLLRGIRERLLPYSLRALFCRLLLHVYIDAEPQKEVLFLMFAR